jgi:hypothetical protein
VLNPSKEEDLNVTEETRGKEAVKPNIRLWERRLQKCILYQKQDSEVSWCEGRRRGRREHEAKKRNEYTLRSVFRSNRHGVPVTTSHGTSPCCHSSATEHLRAINGLVRWREQLLEITQAHSFLQTVWALILWEGQSFRNVDEL